MVVEFNTALLNYPTQNLDYLQNTESVTKRSYLALTMTSSNSDLGREILFIGATRDFGINSCVLACPGTSSTLVYTADP